MSVGIPRRSASDLHRLRGNAAPRRAQKLSPLPGNPGAEYLIKEDKTMTVSVKSIQKQLIAAVAINSEKGGRDLIIK